MRVTSLASGSSGNCYLIEAGATVVLVDAGLAPQRLDGYLRDRGLDPGQLSGILLTHEHSDHIRGARAVAIRLGLPVYANRATLRASRKDLENAEMAEIVPEIPGSIGSLEIVPFRVRHDAADTVGYRLTAEGVSVTIVTDLGMADDRVRAMIREAELVVLEANHDPDLLARGPYPPHLQRRILGSRGHLSNQSAAELAVVAAAGRARTIWLAHLSRVNNRPDLARSAVSRRLQEEGITDLDLQVARRDRPSVSWDSEGANARGQLSLPW